MTRQINEDGTISEHSAWQIRKQEFARGAQCALNGLLPLLSAKQAEDVQNWISHDLGDWFDADDITPEGQLTDPPAFPEVV
jgi:hypothetical protein